MALARIHVLLFVMASLAVSADAEPLRIGVFDVDASPPVGTPLAYDPAKGVQTPLTCRGIVLAGSGQPIVLCAVDWTGLLNDARTSFRALRSSAQCALSLSGGRAHRGGSRRSAAHS